MSFDDLSWYHLDGTECVAGWHGEGPLLGQCVNGGGPVTPCPPQGTVRNKFFHPHYLLAAMKGFES